MKARRSSLKDGFNVLAPGRSQRADRLYESLRKHSIDFASGVPCGVLRQIILRVDEDKGVLHIPANREAEAVGLAAGACLGGKHPMVYMQNSGFFSASNDIASLVVPYRMPIFFIVSFRGCKGEDAIQHLVTGQGTKRLLNTLGMKHATYQSGDIADLVDALMAEMHQASLPVCLLLKRGWDR